MDEIADNRPEMSIANVVIEVGNNTLLREKVTQLGSRISMLHLDQDSLGALNSCVCLRQS